LLHTAEDPHPKLCNLVPQSAFIRVYQR
jgi:hypothetical protein